MKDAFNQGKPDLCIGIDPGIENTGIALWIPAIKVLHLETLPFWSAIELFFDRMHRLPDTAKIIVVMEAPQANRPTFDHGQGNASVREKISQNVGENKAVAKLYQKWFEAHSIEIILKKPNSRSMTKLSAEAFRNLTKYEGKTNSHTRDAAMLVWKM